MSRSLFSHVRPYTCEACSCRRTRPFSTSSFLRQKQPPSAGRASALDVQGVKFVKQRIKELGSEENLARWFPRWTSSTGLRSAKEARQLVKKGGEPLHISVYGRVTARRKLSSQLVFYDIESGYGKVQVMVDAGKTSEEQSGAIAPKVKRGDWIAVSGESYLTEAGEPTIKASKQPELVSPSLQPVPLSISDIEVRNHNRHVDRIIDPAGNDLIRFRHALIRALRSFFENRNFTEVNTPLLTSGAGGATARPFETTASEFGDVTLNLRIAPELFLKRLIVGGIDRVFEIGPAFRNEGVDGTHNPEFFTCEYYQTFADLDTLISDTEKLFSSLSNLTHDLAQCNEIVGLIHPDPSRFQGPFKRISFIPALEQQVRGTLPDWTFPDLTIPDASASLLEVFVRFDITVPQVPTLPRLLDALAGHFLEPFSAAEPTWLVHHPECMSPLAKSYTDASASVSGFAHPVSARAELFVDGREYVNCYEEENNPLVQRRKFEDQLRLRTARDGEVDAETAAVVDESYISALEWGLPPTGGWGCGIDRLVMLFSGRSRIADVLPFGTLNNVVGLGSHQGVAKAKAKEGKKIKP